MRDWPDAGSTAVIVVDSANDTATIHRCDGTRIDFGARDVLALPDQLLEWPLAVAELLRGKSPR